MRSSEISEKSLEMQDLPISVLEATSKTVDSGCFLTHSATSRDGTEQVAGFARCLRLPSSEAAAVCPLPEVDWEFSSNIYLSSMEGKVLRGAKKMGNRTPHFFIASAVSKSGASKRMPLSKPLAQPPP
jgi:hypothetical protein